jgi:hypothetical protein
MPVWVKQIPLSMASGKITVIKGQVSIDDLFTNGNKATFFLSSSQSSTLLFNTVYFPGWKVFIDGNEAPFSFDNKEGLIQFDVNKGKHLININFSETPLRLFSDFLSIISLVVLFGLVIKNRNFLKT